MARFVFQTRNLGLYGGVAVEQIFIFQQICFKGHDLLHPHRPLLIPGARQAQSFIPGWQLYGPGAGIF